MPGFPYVNVALPQWHPVKAKNAVIPAKGEAGISRCIASRPLNRVAMQGHPWERIQSSVFPKSWADWVPACAETTKF